MAKRARASEPRRGLDGYQIKALIFLILMILTGASTTLFYFQIWSDLVPEEFPDWFIVRMSSDLIFWSIAIFVMFGTGYVSPDKYHDTATYRMDSTGEMTTTYSSAEDKAEGHAIWVNILVILLCILLAPISNVVGIIILSLILTCDCKASVKVIVPILLIVLMVAIAFLPIGIVNKTFSKLYNDTVEAIGNTYEDVIYKGTEGITYTRDYDKGGYYYIESFPENAEEITIPRLYKDVLVLGFANTIKSSSVKKVHISSGIKYVGALDGCSSLTEITVSPNNPVFRSKDGMLISKDKQSLMYVPRGLTDVTIPKCVTRIGCSVIDGYDSTETFPYYTTYRPFSYFTDLQSVTIHNKVTSISEGAFTNCTSLTSITIPDSVTTIGKGAFSGCANLESITLPFVNTYDNAQIIEYPDKASLFGYIFGTTEYDESVKVFQVYYEYNQENRHYDEYYYIPSSLKQVTITSAVVPNGAFMNCSSLSNISFTELTSIGKQTFSGCSGLTSVTIPDSITSIGDCAFFGCSGLTSVIIPNSVTSIGDCAFCNCSSLETVYWNATACTSAGSHNGGYRDNTIFKDCYNLKTVVIGDNVTAIPSYAFYDRGITNVTIGSSVTSIGSHAFASCSRLTSITIPDSVTSIGGSAFYNCSSLTSITIPDSVTSIGDSAFFGCSRLTAIKFNGTVEQWEKIEKGFFWHSRIPATNVVCSDGEITL